MPSAGCWWYFPLAWSVVLACYTPPTPPDPGVRLTESQVLAIVREVGLPDEMVQVAWCESRFWSGTRNTDGEDSRGLFQINYDAHGSWASGFDWADPLANARMAKIVFDDRAGWDPKGGLNAWTCAHESHLGLVSDD